MRVISGISRGTKLNSIDSISTRPTLDRVKESIFNIIQNDINGKIFIDLFAGSGAIGIEALSRGARKVYFCDNNKNAIKYVRMNLEKTKLQENSVILIKDFKKALIEIKEKCNIVFIDPPYKSEFAIESVKIILENNILNNDGKIIIETDEPANIISELKKIQKVKIYDTRKYGRAYIIFISLMP